MTVKSLNNLFGSVSVITLPKRKEYVKKIMRDMKISVDIFDAILGKDLDKNVLIKNKILKSDSTLKTNEIACALSHISVIKRFYDSSEKDTLFVFEDDIELNKDYYDKIANVMKTVPDDWEYIQFGHCWNNCLTMKKVEGTDYLYISSNPLCGHSYALNKKGAKKILDDVNEQGLGNDPMDVVIVKLMNKGLKLYTVYPRVFNQMKGVTSSFNSLVSTSNLGNNDSCGECQLEVFNNYKNIDLFMENYSLYINIFVLGLFLLMILRR